MGTSLTEWYEVGTDVDLLGEWADRNGDLRVLDALTLQVWEPDGTLTTKVLGDMTNPSQGVYFYSFLTTQTGLHTFTFTAVAGGQQVVKSGFFRVRDMTPA